MKNLCRLAPTLWIAALTALSWNTASQASEVIQIDAKVYRFLSDGSEEIIATPQLITLPGEWATFRDVESITYATDFGIPSIPKEFAASAAPQPKTDAEPTWVTNDHQTVIPAHPTKFETKDHGLTFKIRPRLGNAGKIFIDCEVEQVSFDGYADAKAPITFDVPKPLGRKAMSFSVENRHTRLATFRTRQQEFLFSPKGNDYITKITSDISDASPGSKIKDDLPELMVSLKARRIPLAEKSANVPDDTQIYVTSRFIESTVPLDLKKLTLSDSEYQHWIREINAIKGVDLLAAPSIMLREGQAGNIEIHREFIYPTEYDPPELPNNPAPENSFPVTPSNPTLFETKNIGVSSGITARIVENGQIELELSPEVVAFEGFENYGAYVYLLQKNSVGKYEPIVLTENAIEMPRFAKRGVDYKVRIASGDQVIVRGLLKKDSQTIETKVPFLGDLPLVGRLGRSSTVEKFERHYYIVFSAEFMDPTGTPIED